MAAPKLCVAGWLGFLDENLNSLGMM